MEFQEPVPEWLIMLNSERSASEAQEPDSIEGFGDSISLVVENSLGRRQPMSRVGYGVVLSYGLCATLLKPSGLRS